jgi:protein SCO1/2/putative membrane protein
MIRRDMKAVSICLSLISLFTSVVRGDDLPEPRPGPVFALTNHHGQPFGSDQLKGKVWIADFIFINCAGPCPMMTHEMIRLTKQIKNPNVRFVSVTVDPTRDTPVALAKYALDMGATDERFVFLTGTPEQIQDVARGLIVGVGAGGDGQHAIFHSDRFIVVDQEGRMHGAYSAMEPEQLEKLKAKVGQLVGNEWLKRFPAINASLNATAGIFLCFGLILIKARKVRLHATAMILAVISSAAFLACYVTFHLMKEGLVTRFPAHATWRPAYLAILGSHTILAVVILPMVLVTLTHAARRRWDKHRRIARPTFWIWLYVSITGVIVYWMLYHLAPTLQAS